MIKRRKVSRNEIKNKQVKHLTNDNIPFRNFKLIDAVNNKNHELISKEEALKIAAAAKLDLVCINAKNKPAIVKLMDYGKFLYDSKKRIKERQISGEQNKAKNVVKLIQLSPNISQHDINFKINDTIGFLKKGFKVKVKLKFFGRQAMHKDVGMTTINNFKAILNTRITDLADFNIKKLVYLQEPKIISNWAIEMLISYKG